MLNYTFKIYLHFFSFLIIIVTDNAWEKDLFLVLDSIPIFYTRKIVDAIKRNICPLFIINMFL